MSGQDNQMKQIDDIMRKTIGIMESAQKDIFDIAEHSQKELEEMEKDLEKMKEKAARIIDEVDRLRKEERKARYRLLVVSRDFSISSEKDIKQAYKEAEKLKVLLSLKEQEEMRIREERDRLEIKLISERKLKKKAENVVSHMGAVLDYLRVGAEGIDGLVEDVRKKQYLGYRVIKAAEEERRKLVREIHDVPVQAMVSVGIRLELCLQVLDRDIEKARDYIKGLKEQVNSDIQDLRKIIYNLRPMSLDDLGLVATVEKYLKDFEGSTGIITRFRVLGTAVDIKGLIQIALFRIIQESLNNIKRHSLATRAMVKMEFTEDSISLLVADNGKGFEADRLERQQEEERGFGLISIRERVELLQGYMEINTKRKKGTRIFVKIPLE